MSFLPLRAGLRSVVVSGALAFGGGLALCAPSTGFAQEATAPLISFLPIDPPAPGQTVEVRVLALGPDGAPLAGLSLTPSATLGEVGAWTAAGDGLYAFPYTAPPRGGAPVLTIRGEAPGKIAVERSLSGVGRTASVVTIGHPHTPPSITWNRPVAVRP
jgi:hypothetical protein